MSIKVHAIKPYYFFIGTTNGFYVMQINKYSTPNIYFNY